MATFLVILGVVVAVVIAGIFPWALLRKLEGKDKGREER